jgi:16S rRNA pseudouridine516 synthase
MERLDKVISNSKDISRSEIRKKIKEGKIWVDGEMIRDVSFKVDPYAQEIMVEGEPLHYKKFVYIQMNKPQGILSATTDKHQKTCIDLLPDDLKKRGIFPAGRLDKDTEGLLLLTDDGNLAHNILSPKKHVNKKYFAKILGNLKDEDIEDFKQGILLEDGYKSLPAKLEILSVEERADDFGELISWVHVVITEGKYHQIKRMFQALGKRVIFLKRIEIAEITLDPTLGLGEYRELTKDEIKRLDRWQTPKKSV